MTLSDLFSLTFLYDKLKNERKPIVVYGMGDGAEKLVRALKKYDMKPSAFFATDEFVRGQSFLGYKVEKLSDIEKRFSDFNILLAFGTSLTEVVGHINNISLRHPIYAPDLNVTGDPEDLLTPEYLRANKERLSRMYSILEDDSSKEILINSFAYKLTGEIKYLRNMSALARPAFFSDIEVKTFADLGAYTGDTVKLTIGNHPELRRFYALEPDPRSFKKLSEYAETLKGSGITYELYRAAAWSKNETLCFTGAGGRNSSLNPTFFNQKNKKVTETEAISLDSIAAGNPPDLIKIDVEGAETEALEGMKEILKTFTPSISLSVYHKYTDILDLFQWISEHTDEKHYSYHLDFPPLQIPCWDLRLCVKRKPV